MRKGSASWRLTERCWSEHPYITPDCSQLFGAKKKCCEQHVWQFYVTLNENFAAPINFIVATTATSWGGFGQNVTKCVKSATAEGWNKKAMVKNVYAKFLSSAELLVRPRQSWFLFLAAICVFEGYPNQSSKVRDIAPNFCVLCKHSKIARFTFVYVMVGCCLYHSKTIWHKRERVLK